MIQDGNRDFEKHAHKLGEVIPAFDIQRRFEEPEKMFARTGLNEREEDCSCFSKVQLKNVTLSSAAATPVHIGDLAVFGGNDKSEKGYEMGKAVGTVTGVAAIVLTLSKTFEVSRLLKT
ncbi:hypothetical protein RHS01_08879 [Rhizoctonia solani]|uniref:Uncharacterized protein n=1 Tax=Rhizoctonia solani TaxID=456999 RepID=A0A8H7I4V7_9AGAM|nr:hypothetical protein RHS01_08879 [Rhizoctonia solani]